MWNMNIWEFTWFSDFLVQISLFNLSWKYLENIKSWNGANNFEESCKFWTTISNLVIGSADTAGQMSTKVKQTQVWQSRKWSGRGWSSTSIKGWGWCSALARKTTWNLWKRGAPTFFSRELRVKDIVESLFPKEVSSLSPGGRVMWCWWENFNSV